MLWRASLGSAEQKREFGVAQIEHFIWQRNSLADSRDFPFFFSTHVLLHKTTYKYL